MSDFGIASKAIAGRLWDPTDTRPIEGSRAPEFASGSTYTNKIDIWSMGCILYELVSNKCVFSDDIAVFKHYFRHETVDVSVDSTFEENDKDNISSTLRRMLNREPSERPSASRLYKEFSKYLEAKNVQAKRHSDNEKRDPDCLEDKKIPREQGKLSMS